MTKKIPIYEKIRLFTFSNTSVEYSKFLTIYRDEIFEGVNKKFPAKERNYYDFEWMDKAFVKEYMDERYKNAGGIEKKLLDELLKGKNVEQTYGEFTHTDDNEHIFVHAQPKVNGKKLKAGEKVKDSEIEIEPNGIEFNFASTNHMSAATRYSFVATTILERFLSAQKKEVSILDIGCSKGTFLYFWKNLYQPAKKPSINYTGVDIRQDVIDYCNSVFIDKKAKKNNISFLKCDIMTENLPAEKYDVILLMEIIEHVPKKYGNKILTKCKELLSDDGILIISSPNPKKEIGQMLTNPQAHIFEYSRQEMLDLLTSKNLQVEDESGWFGRGRYITLGLTPFEKTLYDMVTRLGPGFRMSLFSFLRPDLAECYTMICRNVEGDVDHKVKVYPKAEVVCQADKREAEKNKNKLELWEYSEE